MGIAGRSVEPHRQDLARAENSATGKKYRRGRGGGYAAQQETEARDLLESLRAACVRRSAPRISKSLDRVLKVFSTTWAPPELHMEALQTCEQARQILWMLSMEKNMKP